MNGPSDHPEVPEPVSSEALSNFSYRSIEKGDRIGAGGDADVFRATVTQGGVRHRIALKEPRFQGTLHKDTIQRFRNEAETWASIDDHENVVTVYEYGTDPIPWIALEYMDGNSIERKLGAVDVPEGLWQAGRIADGIRHGHRHGVAHLDIKPANVLLRKTATDTWDYPKVSDWGLAKMLLDHSNSVEGISPQYGAPEQFDPDGYGRPDDYTDIYQLGTVLYALLTGRPPFEGPARSVMRDVLETQPDPPSVHNSALSSGIDDGVLKALAKEKSERYESMAFFRRELDRLFDELVEEADDERSAPVPTSSGTGVNEDRSPEQKEPSGNNTEHRGQSTQSTESANRSDRSGSAGAPKMSQQSRTVTGTGEATASSSFLTRRKALTALGLGAGGTAVAATQLLGGNEGGSRGGGPTETTEPINEGNGNEEGITGGPDQTGTVGNRDTDRTGIDVQNVSFRMFDPQYEGTPPTDRHFNPWNRSKSGCWHPGAGVFDRLAVYSPYENEAYPLVAESWGMPDDTTLEVTLRDDWSWHNGDPVVAQDCLIQSQIELEISRFESAEDERPDPHVKGSRAIDDRTIRFDLHDPFSEIFAVKNTIAGPYSHLTRGIYTKHDDDQWSEWRERLLNTSGSEKESVVQEIRSSSYPALGGDQAIGNGPFRIKSVSESLVVLERYAQHPNADTINFEEFELKLFPDVNSFVTPYANGEVDAVYDGFPVQDALQSELPDHHTLVSEGQSSNMLFAFNCGHGVDGPARPTYDSNVRKAICHVFDKSQTESRLQGVNRLYQWPACRVPGEVMSDDAHEIASFVRDNCVEYGQNDTARAADLLRESGYERDGDNWYEPDGSRFELTIMGGTERDDLLVLRQNLEDFGIETDHEAVDDGTFDTRREDGDYDVMPDGSVANGVTNMWAIGLVPNWLQSITHFAPETEIPMPVGDPAGSSGTKTIDVEEHIRQWQSTGDRQYHRELIWWWNQTVPQHENLYRPDAGAYDGQNWDLDVRDGIKHGVMDALYVAPKLAEGTLRYVD